MIATANPASTTPPSTSSPNDQIESMTGRRHLSWSQLSSYRGCPRKWFFSHVEGLEPEFVASSLIFGSAIHGALQFHCEQFLSGSFPDVTQLVDVYRQHWKDELTKQNVPVQYGKTETEDELHNTAERMLDVFSKSELATLPNMVAVEETLTGSIHPELPDLVARIDVAWQTDQATHLMDFKTAQSRWSQAKVDESSDQLLLYSLLASQRIPDQAIHLHFGIITKAKSPAVQMLEVSASPGRTQQVVRQMLPVWKAMKAGVDYANPNPMNCSTCPYRGRCPAHICSDHDE